MRSAALALLVSAFVYPAAAATINFEVTFTRTGGQSCAFNVCTPLAAGEVRIGTFSLEETELSQLNLLDIAGSSNFPNIVLPPPTAQSGSVSLYAAVGNETVLDVLIGVTWLNYVLEFGNEYSFQASGGRWGQSSTTTGGPLNVLFYQEGTYVIEQATEPIPEPASIATTLGAAVGLYALLRQRMLTR